MKLLFSNQVPKAAQVKAVARLSLVGTMKIRSMPILFAVLLISSIGQPAVGQTWEELVLHAWKGHTGVIGSIEARAAQGNPIAQVFLGYHIWHWKYTVNARWKRYRDESTAVKWYRRAAQLNYAFAQNLLGDYYSEKSDYGKAIAYYRKAADQGFAQAQYNLANMYGSGRGVPRNLTAYEMWLRRAASQDHMQAHYDLGEHYVYTKEKRRQRLIQGYFHMSRAGTIVQIAKVYGTDTASQASTEWESYMKITRSEFDAVKRLLKAWRFTPPPSHAGHVREVQELLKRMGYPVCSIDGVWGYCTMRAYYRYLEDIGAVPGGYRDSSYLFYSFTRETLMALRKSARLRR